MTLRLTVRSLALPTAAAIALACTALFAPPASAKSSPRTMRHHKTVRSHSKTVGRSHATMKGHAPATGKAGVPTAVPPPNGAGAAASGGTL